MELLVKTNGIRLDKYIASETDFSRTIISKMLDSDFIKVNGKLEKASYKVQEGDVIELREGFVENVDIIPQKMSLDIVYEDNDLIVVNKPSGLVVHPGAGNVQNTLVNALLHYTQNLSDANGLERPGIVHRIDKDTSGLLLVAKNNHVHQVLTEYFQKHEKIRREYIALICGVFSHDTATVDAPIGRDATDRKKMTVTSKNGKKAITHIQVLKRYKEYTLIKCVLETGRTHQIRVHLKYIGYPIYNDPVYNTKKTSDFGQFLHSAKMELIHPVTNKKMVFEAPLPSYFEEFISSLELYQKEGN